MVRVTKLELHRTISDIMGKANLDQLTTKKIRLLCEQKYNIDLTSRKQEIDKIVMAFVLKKSVDEQMVPNAKPTGSIQMIPMDDSDGSADDENSSYESDEEGSSCSSRSGSQSCSDSECSYSESSDEAPAPKAEAVKKVKVSAKPEPKVNQKKTVSVIPQERSAVSKTSKIVSPNKRQKKDVAKKVELDDASYARQLQAEEWNFRQRTSRKLFRDIPQKKVGKDEQAKKKKASPFMKKCSLSPALAELMGANEMSRPDVVQKMWSVVRERELFDPSNKQYAKCDEQLMKLFGKKRVRLIGMMKFLKHHIKDIS